MSLFEEVDRGFQTSEEWRGRGGVWKETEFGNAYCPGWEGVSGGSGLSGMFVIDE